MKTWKGIALGVFLSLAFIAFIAAYTGLSGIQFDGRDHPEIYFGHGEYISNETDGTLDMGAANITTTGTVASGAITMSGTGNTLTTKNSYFQADRFRFGYSSPDSIMAYGSEVMKVYNKGASATDLAANDVCQWDTSQVEVGADTTKGYRLVRLTNNVMFDCFAWLKVTRPANTNADTIYVTGKDPLGVTVTEKISGAAGSQTTIYSRELYSEFTTIRTTIGTGNSGSYKFDGIYYNAVIASAGTNSLVCGVANGAIADSGGTGYIVTKGFVKATVDAATLAGEPGCLIVGTSSGDAVTVVTATVDSTKNAKILGRLAQPAYKDNTAVIIFVDPK
jgi:hypothetical protein